MGTTYKVQNPSYPENLFLDMMCLPEEPMGTTYKVQNSASESQEHLFRYDVALGFSQDFWNCDNHKQESATRHQNTIMKPKDPSGGGAPCISSGSMPEGPCSFGCEAKLHRKECDL